MNNNNDGIKSVDLSDFINGINELHSEFTSTIKGINAHYTLSDARHKTMMDQVKRHIEDSEVEIYTSKANFESIMFMFGAVMSCVVTGEWQSVAFSIGSMAFLAMSLHSRYRAGKLLQKQVASLKAQIASETK
jgi:hypothetical protein